MEAVIGAPAKFKADAKNVKMKSKGKVVALAPTLTISAGDADRNTNTQLKTLSISTTIQELTSNEGLDAPRVNIQHCSRTLTLST